jgi:hypothetical protein
MLNHATDDDIVEVIKLKKLDQQLKFQLSDKDDKELVLPVPPKTNPPKKKKKT